LWQNVVNGLSLIIQYFYLATESLGIPSYGLAIIFFTIAVKLLLFPLTRMQMRSMSAMQELQPKIKAIQEKYKDKPEKSQQEMMKLYKEKGANPFAGCLPLLIQMPIIFALFTSLRTFFDPVNHPSFVNLAKANFLWVPNLGQPDPIVLPLLTVLATFGQQYMSSMASAGKIDQTQRTMLIVMPLFVGWIARTLPAGLTLYWVMFSLVSAVEMVVIRRTAKTAKGAGSKA
jgi:YidC/Oxa1 family membrane protein insertase